MKPRKMKGMTIKGGNPRKEYSMKELQKSKKKTNKKVDKATKGYEKHKSGAGGQKNYGMQRKKYSF